MATHSSGLPGKPHGQRSLVADSPWGRKESDPTETHSSTQWLKTTQVYSLTVLEVKALKTVLGAKVKESG